MLRAASLAVVVYCSMELESAERRTERRARLLALFAAQRTEARTRSVVEIFCNKPCTEARRHAAQDIKAYATMADDAFAMMRGKPIRDSRNRLHEYDGPAASLDGLYLKRLKISLCGRYDTTDATDYNIRLEYSPS
jgi:hypothetical protein